MGNKEVAGFSYGMHSNSWTERRWLHSSDNVSELGRILAPAEVGILPSSAFADGLDEAIQQLP